MNNFTPRAQQVLAHARREADRFNHHYIGTEHLLLGLLKLGKGVAVTILENLGVELTAVRKQVEEQIGRGTEPQAEGNIPYTPRVRKVLAMANREAQELNHTYVGTETCSWASSVTETAWPDRFCATSAWIWNRRGANCWTC